MYLRDRGCRIRGYQNNLVNKDRDGKKCAAKFLQWKQAYLKPMPTSFGIWLQRGMENAWGLWEYTWSSLMRQPNSGICVYSFCSLHVLLSAIENKTLVRWGGLVRTLYQLIRNEAKNQGGADQENHQQWALASNQINPDYFPKADLKKSVNPGQYEERSKAFWCLHFLRESLHSSHSPRDIKWSRYFKEPCSR